MTAPDLLPCHCGGAAEMVTEHVPFNDMGVNSQRPVGFVRCTKCGCSSPRDDLWTPAETHRAAAMWNSRAAISLPRCATCVHWKPVEHASPYQFREIVTGGACACPKMTSDFAPGCYAPDALVHQEEEGVLNAVALWTGPQFGCVHHKEKPA